MKIVIPTNENSLESSVCLSFGRAPYFLVYDTETKQKLFYDNSALMHTGGAGIKAAQAIVDYNVNALLTPRCGANAADVLSAAEIQIYQTTHTLVTDTIDAFTNGHLPLLNEIHAGFHNHGRY